MEFSAWTQIHFLNRIRRFLIDLLKKESRTGAVRSQTTTWIRYRKDRELVELAFNPNQYGGAIMAPYSFSSISPERLELRPSNFLTFSFYLLAVRKI